MHHFQITALWVVSVAFSLATISCESAPPSHIAVTLQATPVEGFAPLAVTLSATVEDDALDPLQLSYEWRFGDDTTASGGAEITHVFQQSGTYTTELDVSGARAVGSASADVLVWPEADLRVGAPAVDRTTVTTSDDLRLTFDLFNDADEIPVPFEVGVYLAELGAISEAMPPDPQVLEDMLWQGRVERVTTYDLDRLSAASQLAVELVDIRIPCGIPSGTWELLVYADTEGVVGEVSELNNAQLGATPIVFTNRCNTGPDLIVEGLTATPTVSNELHEVTVEMDIANLGLEPSGGFGYEVFLSAGDTLLEDQDELLHAGRFSGLAAAFTQSIDTQVFGPAEPITALGDYYVLVQLDVDDEVEETDETNNLASAGPLSVIDGPIPPDIAPLSLTMAPNTSFLDGRITLDAVVANLGPTPIDRQFFCRVYLSDDDTLDPLADTLLDAVSLPAMAEETEQAVNQETLIPSFVLPGSHHVFLSCDPSDVIEESNEANNTLAASERLSISAEPEVDLQLGVVSMTASPIPEGDDLVITAEVCNVGTHTAETSILRGQQSRDPTPDVTDTVLFDLEVPDLPAGECTEVTSTTAARCDTFVSNYRIFLALDATEVLAETDEINNLYMLSDLLTIEGAFCVCEQDTLDGSTQTSPIFLSAGTWCDLTMCLTNEDFYAVSLEAGDALQVVTTFESGRGDLDLTLLGTDWATVLDSSTSEGDIEEVAVLVAPDSGDYFIEVAGHTELDVNRYCLTIATTWPTAGIDLIATTVSTDTQVPVPGETIEVGFDVVNLGNAAAGAHRLELWLSTDIQIDPERDSLLSETDISDGIGGGSWVSRALPVTLPADVEGGDYYVAVLVDTDEEVEELDEGNNVGWSPRFTIDAGCLDPAEPNDSPEDAYPLDLSDGLASLPDLLVCSENADFYHVCAQAGDALSLRAAFDAAEGDVDLRLYESGGNIVAISEGALNDEQITLEYVAADQCYTLEVFVIGAGREVPYELTVARDVADESLWCPSGGEPNDSEGAAGPLIDLLQSPDLAICPATDVDYFRFSAAAGTSLVLTLTAADGLGAAPSGLRMSLWDSTGAYLAGTVAATEPLSHTLTSSGDHYLRVVSSADADRNQPYQVLVSGLDGVDLGIAAFDLTTAEGMPGDRIEVAITIENGLVDDAGAFDLGVYLATDPIVGDADSLIYDERVEGLAGGETIALVVRPTIPAEAAADVLHFVGVRVDASHEITESSETNNEAVGTLFVLPPCQADGAEPNDGRLDSADLEAYLEDALTLCDDDEDWFELGVTPGETVQIDALFDSDGGDLDLFVWDQLGTAGTLLGIGDSAALDGESVTVTVPDDVGTLLVYLQVVPWDTRALQYRLTLGP